MRGDQLQHGVRLLAKVELFLDHVHRNWFVCWKSRGTEDGNMLEAGTVGKGQENFDDMIV